MSAELAGGAARPRRQPWRNLMVFLAVVGPGIITANVDNDAGGITTYSLAGAQYGHALLWTLVPITIALVVVQEMSARMGVMTGKGLADLIRENYGVKVTFWIMVALLVADVGNTIAEFSGVAASIQIFGVPPWISVPITAVAVWILVLKGTYRQVEKVFLVACLFYVAYPVSAILAHPDWGTVLRATVTPSFQASGGYVAMLVGVVGTTIAPWMQFYLQSAVVEKGIKPEHYGHSRLDVIVGCIITDVVAFFIIAACAATVFKAGVRVETADQAAMALGPLAGKYASWLFAFGLFNASFFAATILPLATSYYICEAFGWESGIDRKWGEAKQFYSLYTLIVALGAAVVLIPHLPLLRIMLLSQVVNGMLLPFILIFMLLLINKEKLMGPHRNGPWFNGVAWLTTVVMIVLTAWLVVTGLRDLVTGA
ncbi:Nramp family divalent metal transporter [Anaeromyxobacter paludicola]|uniref:Mn transporter n=1 Tax=Anaeromyxobacter paludicola TaxID=2918171 RepID=A0ABM7X8I4_9BACT|nr:Nramp family divalent metal transporter [Anaeromyxobacter paludicola]BDG08145.1 Mn transporter [Anaeromyxobacter paludicola]